MSNRRSQTRQSETVTRRWKDDKIVNTHREQSVSTPLSKSLCIGLGVNAPSCPYHISLEPQLTSKFTEGEYWIVCDSQKGADSAIQSAILGTGAVESEPRGLGHIQRQRFDTLGGFRVGLAYESWLCVRRFLFSVLFCPSCRLPSSGAPFGDGGTVVWLCANCFLTHAQSLCRIPSWGITIITSLRNRCSQCMVLAAITLKAPSKLLGITHHPVLGTAFVCSPHTR
jgi:hypothetical protein